MSIAQKFRDQVTTWAALVGKDSNNDPAAVTVTNGALSVGSSPNFVDTAANCQTQANLLSTTDVGIYTFFANDTNQYGTLSAYAGGVGTITWETTAGAAHVADPALTFITYAGNGYTYYCEAAVGSARSDAAWRVLRKTDSTGDMIYAGTGVFDQAADDLATVAALTYTLGA